MITGAVLTIAGLALGLRGSFAFQVGDMLFGWAMAGVGVVVFISSIVRLP